MAVFADMLSRCFRTLSPDLRGYGRSRFKHPFRMQDHLQDLEALLEIHGVQQCLVLGWSLGGILAMELALQRPDRVAGLILIATAARPLSNHPPTSWRDDLATGVASLLNWLVPAHPWVIDAFGKRSLYRYLIQQHTPFAYQQLASAGLPAYLRTSRQATRALNQAIRAGYNRLPDIRAIEAPTLMLCGECDRHITAAASLETAHALPNCKHHCYPNTAHLFPWEIPRQVLSDINGWIERELPMLA